MSIDLVVAGVPLAFIVLGVVEYIKGFGLSGNALRGVSMGVGVVFGIAGQFANGGLPADPAGWVGLAFYGVAVGLFASGLYDFRK